MVEIHTQAALNRLRNSAQSWHKSAALVWRICGDNGLRSGEEGGGEEGDGASLSIRVVKGRGERKRRRRKERRGGSLSSSRLSHFLMLSHPLYQALSSLTLVARHAGRGLETESDRSAAATRQRPAARV